MPQDDATASTSATASSSVLHQHSHGLRRYYLGPSPVSSRSAAKVAAALREQEATQEPVGVAIVAREGLLPLRIPAELGVEEELDAEKEAAHQGAEENVQTATSEKPATSHYAGLSRPRSWSGTNREITGQPSTVSAVSFISAKSRPHMDNTPQGHSNGHLQVPQAGHQPPSDPSEGSSVLRRQGSAMAVLSWSQVGASNDTEAVKKPRRQLSFDVPPTRPSGLGRTMGTMSEGGASTPVGSYDGGNLQQQQQLSPRTVAPNTAPPAVAAWHQRHPDFPPDTDHRGWETVSTETDIDQPNGSTSQNQSAQVAEGTDDGRGGKRLRGVGSKQSLASSKVSSRRSLRDALKRRGYDQGQRDTSAGILNTQQGSSKLPTMRRQPQGPRVDEVVSQDHPGQQQRSASVARFADSSRTTQTERQMRGEASASGRLLHPPQAPPNKHGRDFSRASRMSRASTAGTLASVFSTANNSRFTEDSFGASGGFRARIARAFKPRGSAPSKETPASAPQNRRKTAAELAAEVKETRQRWRGGVAPGQVGTSAGGTKWVGQGFEIGRDLLQVLEQRKERIAQSSATAAVRVEEADRDDDLASQLALLSGKEGKSGKERGEAGSAAGEASPKLHRTPSAVLKGYADEARLAQGQKSDTFTATTVNGRSAPAAASSAASMKLHVPPKGAQGTFTASKSQKTPASPRSEVMGPISEPSSSSSSSSAVSAETEPSPDRIISPASTDASNLIESGQGWAGLAFKMSTERSLRSSELARNVVEGAEQRLRDMKQRKSGSSGPKPAPRRAVSAIEDHRGTEPPAPHSDPDPVSTSQSSTGEVIDLPQSTQRPLRDLFSPVSDGLATSGTGWVSAKDYFEDAVAETDHGQSSKPRGSPTIASTSRMVETPESQSSPTPKLQHTPPSHRMTLAQATSHPVPPREADEKFPEATLQLLRRPSDMGQPSVENPAQLDTASDHAVIVGAPLGYGPRAAEGSNDGVDLERERTRSTVGQTAADVAISPKSHADSRAPLLKNQASMGSIVVHDSKPLGAFGSGRFGGKKTVQFDKAVVRPPAGLRSISEQGVRSILPARKQGDAAPAPPHEVLSRATSSTSAGTPRSEREQEQLPPADDFITRRSILRRDRMLVRNDWTASETLPQDFDETASRRFQMHPGAWCEYIVVLRQSRIELWSDPTRASRFRGRKDKLHLAFVIPLSKGSTHLSMFSYVDRIFCLTYSQSFTAERAAGGSHRQMLHLRRSGTNVVLFEARAMSVAADWLWELWRELGGHIPDSLEVHVPSADVRVRFPIPEEMPCQALDDGAKLPQSQSELALLSRADCVQPGGTGEGYKLINRRYLTTTMLRKLSGVKEWEEPLQTALKRGIRLELAWRKGVTLDWVLHDNSLDGHRRDWSVLCGSILKEARQPANLEYRAAVHYPTTVMMPNGRMLEEPAALEGYIWRVKPVSGTLTRIYATTHDQHVFVCKPSRAHAPDRHVAVAMDSAFAMWQQSEASKAAASMAPGGGRAGVGTSFRPLRRSKSAAGGSVADYGGGQGGDTASVWSFGGASRCGSIDEGRGHRRRGSTVSVSGVPIGQGRGKRGRRSKRDDAYTVLRRHVLETMSTVAMTTEDVSAQMDAFRAFERRRQYDQITNADGFVDIRHILSIRWLGSGDGVGDTDDLKPGTRSNQSLFKRPGIDPPVLAPMPLPLPTEHHPDEEADVGGEEGLNTLTTKDRQSVRRSRQFEIVMINGRSTRFEAYSRSVAKEWVIRLHDLSCYWKRREKIDALELMEASGFDPSLLRQRVGPGSQGGANAHASSFGDVRSTTQSLLLSNVWHWCTIMACRGIVRSGRLFVKSRAHSAFHSRYYILLAGRMLSYKLLTGTRTARGRQNAGIFHKRQGARGPGTSSSGGTAAVTSAEADVIPLRDSYIWTGRLTDPEVGSTGRSEGAGAMGAFASGGATDTGGGTSAYVASGGQHAQQSDDGWGGRHKVPRLYADGMISLDEDEDCSFVIRYRPASGKSKIGSGVPGGGSHGGGGISGASMGAGHKRVGRSGKSNMPGDPGLSMLSKDSAAAAAAAANAAQGQSPAQQPRLIAPVPSLSDASYTTLVLRARSKVERDLWVRALHYERERLVREDEDERYREDRVRNKGDTPWMGR